MSFHEISLRPRARGGLASNPSKRKAKSPVVTVSLDQQTFDRIASEAEERLVPVSQVIRECVALRFRPEAA